MSITTQQITEIQMDVFFSDADHVLQALLSNIAEGDEEGIRYILAECHKRDIDLAPAICRHSLRYSIFESKKAMRVSGKPFRVPVQTKGN